MVQNRTQLVRAYILSAVVVLVAVLGSLLYAETASVKLTVPPQKLVATATLSGSQSGGDLKTHHIDATVVQSQVGSASTVEVAPTYATGNVVFSCTSSQCPTTVVVGPGTIVTTSFSLGYATLDAATVTRTRSATVAVKAIAPGASWNTAPGAVTIIINPPSSDLKVTNPKAISGGADARSAQIIQQSDFDSVREALATKVGDALGSALMAKAVDMSYIANGPPVLTVTSDHKVGDITTTFTVAMTGTLGATAFSNSDAKALIRAALDASVPAGQQLTSDSIEISWQILQTSPNGDITVKGTALGFVTPNLSIDTLRARIRGLSPADARKSLERAVPGSSAEIQISPVALPWLPLIAEHITVTVVVKPAGQ